MGGGLRGGLLASARNATSPDMKQTILITGANRGIGLGLASSWAEDGARVLAACRRPGSARELAALGARYELEVLPVDVASDRSVAALAAAVEGEAIDLLVLNAGIYGPRNRQGLDGIDSEGFKEVLDVNVVGPMRVALALLPAVERSRRKVIAAISSQMGSITRSWGGSYAYRASKAGLNAAMKALSIDLETRGVAALTLHPGWVRTDMGGEEASLSISESVAGLRRVLDRVSLEETGRFFDVDGSELPW